jgi:hypothetical protein
VGVDRALLRSDNDEPLDAVLDRFFNLIGWYASRFLVKHVAATWS